MKKLSSAVKTLLLCLSLLTVYLAYPQRTFACSCMMPGAPAQELANSTAVFAGEVIEIDQPLVPSNSLDPVRVIFKVSEVWKGPVQDQLAVMTGLDEASCGISFAVGQQYLIYASGTTNDLNVTLCSRTVDLASAQADLADLGAGQVPTAATSGGIPLGLVGLLIIGVIVIALLLVIGVVWMSKMRRQKTNMPE